ncbi:MAG TPA: hypothetical protein VMP01_09440 [Pirellulaceae bacterium]|nr:hypothetical protein [Pirellulaceae bacterium]
MFAVLGAFIAGCGGPSVPTFQLVPVTGTVKLNGTPLADAEVQFHYDGDNRPPQYFGSTGKTDPNGKYELLTNAQKGCVEGKFKVVVSKWTDPQGNPVKIDPETGMDLEQLIQQGQAIEFLPPTYSHPERTTLTAEVTAGKADGYDFELTK